MKKEVIVLSLGGSLIIPDNIDTKFLLKFKDIIKKQTKKYKFIIVCGGGSIARKYISALENQSIKLQSFAGISATRTNARFMSYFFGQDQQEGIPQKMRILKKMLKRKDIIFCGALEYKPHQTSDSTAAEIATTFKAKFINLTNVNGLYTSNPKKDKKAKLISKIKWKDFLKRANKIKFRPGQHFVLDQTAAKVILKNKISTYIIGKDIKQLNNLLNKKKFIGTEIKN